MKIVALHNKSGEILAAVHLTPNYTGPRPVAGKGTQIVELEVPQSHASIGLFEICKNLRVDSKNNKLVEHKKSDKAR